VTAMDYITAQEAAAKWKVTIRTIARYAQNGKIKGAVLIGNGWLIPRDAARPADGRRNRNAKDINGNENISPEEVFKCPVYYFSTYYRHRDRLNLLEQQLYDAQEEMLKGNCKKSYAMTKRVWAQAKDSPKYLQLGILYTLCFLGTYCVDTEKVVGYIAEIKSRLQQDFPYKKEMEAILPLVTYIHNSVWKSSNFQGDSEYKYADDILGIIYLQQLESYCLFSSDNKISDREYNFIKLSARILENERSEVMGVVLQCYLVYICSLRNDMEGFEKHMLEAFALARKNDCPLMLVFLVQALGTIANKRLKKFDKNLYDRVISLWSLQAKGALHLNKRLNKDSVYKQYTEDEMLLLIAVAGGRTNVEIATMFSIKENSLSKKLSYVYAKCGISSRNEVKDFVLKHFI